MRKGNKLLCQWVNLGTVPECDSTDKNFIISLYDRILCMEEDGNPTNLYVEIGIFIGKSDNNQEFVVLVFKMNNTDTYVPKKLDNFKRFEEDDESVSFFFDTYEETKNFTDYVLPLHHEFSDRPVTIIS